ncbi:MAG: leucine-rich repeat protein [Clostridia bacterium]|nr:leucine-rich repeat protein [Clostridia bacterium]
MKKFACLFLAIVLVLSLTVGDYTGLSLGEADASAETTSTTVSYSDVTGSMNFSDLQVSNFSSSVLTGTSSSTTSTYETMTVLVSFSDDSMLDAADGTSIEKYETTTEGKKTAENIEEVQKKFYQSLSSEGIAYEKVYSYKNIDNAVAIEIDTSYVSDIKEMEGVDSVVICETYSKPETTETTSTSSTTNATSVYATGVYDSSKYVEDYGGKGMTVAILDTGLDYTHEAFRLTDDTNDYYYAYSQEFKANVKWTKDDISNIMADSENYHLHASGDVYVSEKVPFAFDYSDNDTDVYPSYSNHGTHVAGIIAGRSAYYTNSDGEIVYKDGYNADNTYEYTTSDGYTQIFTDSSCSTLATEEFIGVAPYAQLVICKVFTDDLDSTDIGGATTEDILAALEDCVELGVDVINMSLGSTNGFSSTNDGDDEGAYMEKVYSSIGEHGISLVVAASNDYSSGYGSNFGTNLASNPDSGTVGSPSTYSSAISVASISGKKSQYLVANAGTDNETSVYFRQSADENSVDYDFVEQMLELGANNNYYTTYYDSESGTQVQTLLIKYVVIPGVGQTTSYTQTIKNIISQAHADGYLIVALVKRGTNTFQDKVENAMNAGVDGVLVYNNVAGEIKMTIGDIEDPIPAISTTQVTGQALVDGATNYEGYLTISTAYEAGPFMSDFSSWGVTSDLKLKPEITAHGGEITSSVPGGYTEMSGTSMATPNVSGLMANILSYIKQNYDTTFASVFTDSATKEITYSQKTATELAYQLMMSTATIVYDSDGLPYSPRKQGAGLASLDNLVSTNAYLYTKDETVKSAHGDYIVDTGGRPKIELGEDENKVGEYTLKFYFKNVSGGDMSFTLNTMFFTESLSLDGLAVAEQAYTLEGQSSAVWTINGQTYSNGDTVTFASGDTEIYVTLTLTAADKAYLDASFVNGMFVEGFLQLESTTDSQCDLSIPFMGFYGDWESAPMLDYDAYEIAEIEADTSIDDEEKASETVWATQAYTMYWNESYVLPMGSFLYSQDEDATQIYASEEYCAVSCYNDETADSSNSSSYMTSYAIKGLYAGLLRNAKYVTVTMTDATTGEEIYTKVVYRVGKAVAGGGSASPAYVKLELTPEELGLVENGTYRLEFNFFFQSMDEEITEDNTFSFSFTVDYTAPVLEDVRIRYEDYNDTNGNAQQHVYLDLDVYDNHYAMAVLLCYYDKKVTTNDEGDTVTENQLVLATDYVTPVYNAVKNGTTTVTIQIDDLMDLIKEGREFYVEIDDYALNHSIYKLSINTATSSVLPDTFSVSGATADSKTSTVTTSFNDSGELCVTLGRLDTCTVSLDYDTETYSSANLSNFTWSVISGKGYVDVQNGQIVGLKAGSGVITVAGAGGEAYKINVTVTESTKTLSITGMSFGTIFNASDVPVQASGVVEVNIDQDITLEVQYDPWYYTSVNEVSLEWSSSDTSVATVDSNGNVTLKKKGSAIITATADGKAAYTTSVTLSVQEPFTVSSMSLTDYTGAGGVVYIPTDMNITSIGEEAFKDNTDITAVIIPKSVTSIGKKAFYGCTNLKYVFFVDVTTQDVADAELTLINAEAFEGCTSLEYVDFSNCKTFTVAKYAFSGCTNLKVIKGIENMGTAYDGVFEGCTSLVGSLSADSSVNLVNSITYYDGSTLYEDIDGLTTLVKSTSAGSMSDVTLNLSESATSSTTSATCVININSMDYMANGTNNTLDITGLHVSGSGVFSDCDSVTNISMGEFTSLGYAMFCGCEGITDVTIKTADVGAYAFYDCVNLGTVTFSGVKNGTIGRYAFAASDEFGLTTVTFNDDVTISSIGDYAFSYSWISEFSLPSGLTSLGEDLFYGGKLNELVITTDISDVTFTGTTFASVNNITLGDVSLYEAVEALVVENNILYNKDKTKVILALNKQSSYEIAADVTEIGNYAFSGNTSLTSVTIPDKVKTIGESAFYNCTSLANVTIPDSVKTIGSFAFSGTALTTVEIPANVETIGDGAFYNCGSLATVTFNGTALKTVGDYAFMNTALTAVTLPASVTSVGSYAFCSAPLTSFSFTPSANATIGDYAFADTDLTSIDLDSNISYIGEGAFYNCTALTTATLNGVTSMGDYAFYGAENLSTVTFTSGCGTVGDYTFYYCDNLTTVSLASSIKEIGTGAFAECTSLTTIDLSNIQTVNSYAFYECTSLADINLSNAKTIGDFAFYGNAATTITIPATLGSTTTSTVSQLSGGAVYGIDIYYDYEYTYSSLGAGAFAGAANLTKFVVADGNNDYFTDASGVLYRVLSDGSYELAAYPSAATATSYTVLDDTSRIEAYAFADLTAGKLTSVTLPYETTSIGIGAFYNSGVTNYVFTSYIAPTLEAEVSYNTMSSDENVYGYYEYYMTYLDGEGGGIYRGLYNTNFADSLINYIPDLMYCIKNSTYPNGTSASTTTSTLTVSYPTNGTGYSNYVYSNYFGTKTLTEAVLNTNSYNVYINLTRNWYDLTTINAWATDNEKYSTENAEVVAMVQAFCELVKQTHAYYNNMKNDAEQMELLTAALAEYGISIDLLTQTEDALSAVKEKFGITVTISAIEADTSSYKSEYVAGEYFDMTGLIVVVTYDDYSEVYYTYEDGDLELDPEYAVALTSTMNVVKVNITALSRTVRLSISVTEGDGTAAADGSGLSTGAIIGIVVGCVVVVAAAAAAVVVVLILRKKKGAAAVAKTEETSEVTEESEETEAEVSETEVTDTEENKTDNSGSKPGDSGEVD